MPQPKFKQENYQNLGGINIKASEYITGPFQFLDIRNLDFERPGSLKQRDGSTLYTGATVLGEITGLYEFERLDGSSYLIASANTNIYTVTRSGGFSVFNTGLKDGALFDFVTFVDRLFSANGQDFFKYDGTNVANYSLPDGTSTGVGFTTGPTGTTGLYKYAYGYINDRGYLGPCGPEMSASVSANTNTVLTGLTTPADFGISAIAIFRTSPNGSDLFQIGTTPAGSTQFVDSNLPLGTTPCNDNLYFTLAPRYLEIYNNQLMMAGFSSALSTFYFSDIGEPEAVPPENFIEVRTNDGDRITGMANFLGSLLIFKERSFHILTGDSPNNFLLREISNQYGCLSNRAVVNFEDRILFLDRKGIVEYNGANIKIISNQIESIFLSMNLDAAKDKAVAIHNRLSNQAWFAIPCDGSNENNCIIVYDYLLNAWTIFEGVEAANLAVARREFGQETAFYGSYNGSISHFGSSLYSDNGVGFTCSFKTRFLSEMGKSVTEQYRRLYLDVDPIAGITTPLEIKFKKDYSDDTILERTMYSSEFQSRIDFGIPAKSLAFEMFKNGASTSIQVNGFTIESREQRQV